MSTHSIWVAIGGILLVIMVFLFIKLFPDLQRYLNMSSM